MQEESDMTVLKQTDIPLTWQWLLGQEDNWLKLQAGEEEEEEIEPYESWPREY